MENYMDFMIRLRCVRDVEDFVAMSTAKPYRVHLEDGQHRVNGKSFMEMFCLELTSPLRVCAECSQEELQELSAQCARFRAD